MTATNNVKHVACPTCGKDSPYAPSNVFRPFCSERCKAIDLGAWASESFRVPAPDLVPDQTGEPASRWSDSH